MNSLWIAIAILAIAVIVLAVKVFFFPKISNLTNEQEATIKRLENKMKLLMEISKIETETRDHLAPLQKEHSELGEKMRDMLSQKGVVDTEQDMDRNDQLEKEIMTLINESDADIMKIKRMIAKN